MFLENRKAKHEYTILEEIEAGMVLEGWQASRLRRNKVSWSGPYVALYPVPTLIGLTFTNNPENILLLLNKSQILKLREKVSQKGLTVIPLNIHYNASGKAKCTIALAQGKKNWNKKQAIKERDLDRCKFL